MVTVPPYSQLSLDESGTFRFALPSGNEWITESPFLILHYYDRQHPRAQFVAVPSGDGHVLGTAGTPSLSAKGTLRVEPGAPGAFKISVDFPNIHIALAVEIRLADDGKGFSVRIPDAGVVEEMPELYRILGIEVLPEFGAAITGESGYLTLPNWSGCQTFFDKSYPREVCQTIYSTNDQWEHLCNMGVFGITRAEGTLCGIVTEGDFNA